MRKSEVVKEKKESGITLVTFRLPVEKKDEIAAMASRFGLSVGDYLVGLHEKQVRSVAAGRVSV